MCLSDGQKSQDKDLGFRMFKTQYKDWTEEGENGRRYG